MKKFAYLFQPLEVGGYLLKNRITMAPMLMGYGHIDGTVTDKTIAHYEKRARGGASMVVVEATLVNLKGRTNLSQLRIDNNSFLPGLSKLAKAIKDNGSVSVLQLQHSGRVANVDDPMTASEFSMETSSGIKSRAMKKRDIDATIEDFTQAALRAKMAGFDMVELHGAFGHLLAQFLSPRTNKRDDEYGGSLENRMRFPLEVVEAIKKTTGRNYPVGYQFLADELLPDGFKLADGRVFAENLIKSGVAYLTVTSGNFDSCMIGDGLFAMRSPEGNAVYLAEEIKKVVNIPVFACGKIPDAEFAEKIIEDGKADGVALGRPLLADPDFPEKVRKGNIDDIIHCVYCCGCIDQIERNLGALCDINPEVGREVFVPLNKAEESKKVLIIGGGPAGMMSAITASKRGHKVTLVEKEKELGGEFKYAMLAPGKKPLEKFLKYLKKQTEKSGVNIKLDNKFNIKDVKKLSPQVLIIATGASFKLPDIPGLKDHDALIDFKRVFLEEVKPGEHTLIIGGNATACEVAEFIASKKGKVTIVSEEEEFAREMDLLNRAMVMQKLQEYEVVFKPSAKITNISGNIAVIEEENEKMDEITFDSIICTDGYKPDFSFYIEARKIVEDVYITGDVYKPGGLRQAVHSGYHTAVNL